MVHPLGKRPRAWFGPENYLEGDDPMVESARVAQKQREWDAIYFRMSWWNRLRCYFAGEITEPVGSGYSQSIPV
ncbi:hypothetical protein [Burkholderia ubonensis]|uniref:hypothetical protein n=1 Tax=Burkholderia ubonensis TaxID=101571 RepID=UPI0007587061|nr:hypothetical protein [Burkholderia ubonensis]KVP16868.1 hypothetical protein WJ84_00920 [Burkholderia ubonensis]